MAPALVARLDGYLASRRPGDEPPEWLFFAVHLLGSMRWTPAYRSLVRLLAGDAEAVEEALGDAITTSACNVIYAVFDGDWTPVRHAAIAAEAVEMLGLRQFKPLIERGYAEGRLDPTFATKREVLEGIEHAAATGTPQDPLTHVEPFPADIVAEFRKWHFEEAEPERSGPAEPVRNPLRHVGRNDPCPCGSGRKFKKCCLGALA